MFKIIVFLILFLPSVIGAAPSTEPGICFCPNITNLQKSGQTDNSFTFDWTSGRGTKSLTVCSTLLN